MKREIIHCIGDSHISFFSGCDRIQPVWPERSDDRLPWFRTYRQTSLNDLDKAEEVSKLRSPEIAVSRKFSIHESQIAV